MTGHGRGLQTTLQELTKDTRSWVRLGQVVRVESHPDYGYLATVSLEPDGFQIQCRVLFWGSGSRTGAFFPIKRDDEVLVLLTEGDPNQGVCIAGLTSGPALPPSTFDNGDHIEIVLPGGVKIRGSVAGVVEALTKVSFLDDLTGVLTETKAACVAWGLPIVNQEAMIARISAGDYRTTKLEAE